MSYLLHKKTIVTGYFASYFMCMLFFAFNHMLLWQYRPVFFTHNRDLSELFIIATGLPKFMIAHSWTFLVADILLFAIALIPLIYFFIKGKFYAPFGILFTVYIGIYLLLANIFIQYHEEPYLVYFLFSFLFIVNREDKFYSFLAIGRFYFLYIFFSAAIWKIGRGAIFNIPEMSNILMLQHADVLTTGCHSFFCTIYYYLADHPVISYFFYAGGVLLEVFFAVGFFTARFDKLLFILAVIFFAGDYFLMRISYWSILFAGLPLLLDFKNKIPYSQYLTKKPLKDVR